MRRPRERVGNETERVGQRFARFLEPHETAGKRRIRAYYPSLFPVNIRPLVLAGRSLICNAA
jgi:hypothetical protein